MEEEKKAGKSGAVKEREGLEAEEEEGDESEPVDERLLALSQALMPPESLLKALEEFVTATRTTAGDDVDRQWTSRAAAPVLRALLLWLQLLPTGSDASLYVSAVESLCSRLSNAEELPPDVTAALVAAAKQSRHRASQSATALLRAAAFLATTAGTSTAPLLRWAQIDCTAD
jgi:hypothetical protein